MTNFCDDRVAFFGGQEQWRVSIVVDGVDRTSSGGVQ